MSQEGKGDRFGGEEFGEEFGAPDDFDSESQGTGGPIGFLVWGQLQDAILDAWLDDGDAWDGPAIRELAEHMRSSPEEFRQILESSDPDELQDQKEKKLLERLNIRKSGYNWDKLESAVLMKLGQLVESRRITTAEQLLAIARVANSATRRGSGQGNGNMGNNGNNMTQVNVFTNPTGGHPELPGKGNLGTISLTLTQRTVQQLSRDRIIDADAPRLSERVEMLTPEEVPSLKMPEPKDE